jgi:hypothetical protein
MSSKGRGGMPSIEKDQYFTPLWCLDSLIDAGIPPLPFDSSLPWLEPCAGSGTIIKAFDMVDWHAVELDEKYRQDLDTIDNVQTVSCPQDFLTKDFKQRYAAVLTNPPYTLSFDFVQKAMSLSDTVIMLLRLNWLGSIDRYDFLKAATPDVHILTPRPSFVYGTTDSTEYAWYVWSPFSTGKIHMLKMGPKRSKKVSREFKLYDATGRVRLDSTA